MKAPSAISLLSFAAGVAHAVNDPAAVVNANLHYLSEVEGEDLTEDGRQALRDSIHSMQRISSIVRQLLDAGRLAASAEKVGSVALRQVAEEAARAAQARCGTRAAIRNDVPDGLYAAGQESLIVQVLVNLVVNAAHAIPEGRSGGRIVLRGELCGERARVVVEDNGVGIEPDVLRRVFEPFFTTKPFGSGAGLGLAVSRSLLAGIGGELRLESKANVGTRAIVELSPAKAQEPSGAPALSIAVCNEVVAEAKRRPRLFLVEDESNLRNLASPGTPAAP